MIQPSCKRSVSSPERPGISFQVFLLHLVMALMELLAQSPKIMRIQLHPLQVNMEDSGLKTSTSLAITIQASSAIQLTILIVKDLVYLPNHTVLALKRSKNKLKKSQKRRKRRRESLRKRILILMKIHLRRTHQTLLRLKIVRLIRKRSLKLEAFKPRLKQPEILRVALHLVNRSQLKTYLR